ncbi:DUF169 domain-containing protein [Chloroflexota bacterium]
MTTVEEYNSYGEELERVLLLRTSPIAVKMLEREEDIPEGAYRPKRDRGVHLAQCQVFGMSRCQGATVAMLKEDNWCWAPLIAYGLVEPVDPAEVFGASFPCFEYGEYVGILTAPLKAASFEPDMVVIYSNTAQLRIMLSAVKALDRSNVYSEFDPIDSCAYCVVSTIQRGEYRITIPDPGDYEWGLATEDEIIFSVPKDKIDGLVAGLKRSEERNAGYTKFYQKMRPDFPRPEFYKKLFGRWGLDVEAEGED